VLAALGSQVAGEDSRVAGPGHTVRGIAAVRMDRAGRTAGTAVCLGLRMDHPAGEEMPLFYVVDVSFVNLLWGRGGRFVGDGWGSCG